MDINRVRMARGNGGDVTANRAPIGNSKRNSKKRAHPDLNQGPADLQSAALPLSYTPWLTWYWNVSVLECLL